MAEFHQSEVAGDPIRRESMRGSTQIAFSPVDLRRQLRDPGLRSELLELLAKEGVIFGGPGATTCLDPLSPHVMCTSFG
jgi:hypothetical protein